MTQDPDDDPGAALRRGVVHSLLICSRAARMGTHPAPSIAVDRKADRAKTTILTRLSRARVYAT